MFKVASWNVNSLRVRLPHVIDWLTEQQPDLLALQETKQTDDQFPVDEILAAGYQSVFTGQKTYNGVAILSKTQASQVSTGIPGYADPQQRVIAAVYDDVTLLNLYVPNGSEVGSEKYAYKLDWFSHLHDYVQQLLAADSELIIVGDFNIAPADEDVHDPQEWIGKVLVSEAERAEFETLLGHGLIDCFRALHDEAGHFTWWDYRAAGYRRNRGLRIDHVLASATLCETLRTCWIDIAPRERERPSDHTPIIAEFDW